ncbi:hypothetical protein D3C72_1329230 [compost metagenome]
MPIPSVRIDATMLTGPCDRPSPANPRAKTTEATASTSRPPRRSTQRPPKGLSAAEIRNAPDSPANTSDDVVPVPAASGSASTPSR